ncbi:mycobactin polyketide synthase MbtD [Mycobacterium sp. NPDC050551]|uniref:mycobactin polyketide synthase MbtD n=1 Tax=Mycobacterium sp. NPDC050551 TaxID=3155407 RepID=UPI00344797A8
MPVITWPDGRVPVLLSAHAPDLVGVDAAAVARYLRTRPDTSVADVAGQLLRTRRLRRHRAVLRAADREELLDGLHALSAGEIHPLVARSAEHATPRLAFVCPGQGSQWPAMGADAYHRLPAYRAEADRCAAAFTAAGLTSPLRYLTTAGDPDTFGEIEIQGAQFVHAVALAAVWRACGVAADLTVGHSLGEIAAAHLAGVITLPESVAVVGARAAVTDRMRGRYAVAALGLTAAVAEELIAETPGWLELSVINAGASVAVSGDRDAVAAAVGTVSARGGFAREITVNFPVHTSVLEPLREDFTAALPQARFGDGPMQFIGGATGDVVAAGTEFGDYWYGNLRNMVRFDRAVEAAVRCGAKAFVELSAHPALLFAIGDTLDTLGLATGPAALVGSGHRDADLVDRLSANIAAAAVTDARYRWADLVGDARPLRDFPNAPMRTTHMWVAPERAATTAAATTAPVTIAAEFWRETVGPTTSATAPRTVAVLTPEPGHPLAGPLRAAIEGHPAVTVGPADRAEMLVVVAPVSEQTDAAAAAGELTGRVADGLLDYAAAAGPQCRDVWLVTAGAERVIADDPSPLPAPAALAAMHRSIGFEHPDQTFRHLDLPAGDLDAATATAVAETLFTEAPEAALRGAVLYRRELPATTTHPKAWPLDSGLLDDVVITGGAGAVGLHFARYFAEHGARRIVLLGRSGADTDVLASVAGDHGTQVIAPPCDITDRDQLAATAAEFAGSGASLLVHAAGAAGFATRDHIDRTVLGQAFAAKVSGIAAVGELWPLRPNARILLCSSVSGVWGGRGHAAYSAANRMLDAIAARLRASGRSCVSVRWGLWAADGTSVVDAGETARIERSGLLPMAPRAAIEASLRDHHGDPLIYSADADRLRLFFASQRAAQHVSGADSDVGATDTRAAVRAELASVLSMPDATALDLDASLFDLGVDSLLALDLRKRIKHATGRSVPLARLLGGITGTELIADLDRAGEPADRAEKVNASRD